MACIDNLDAENLKLDDPASQFDTRNLNGLPNFADWQSI